MKTFPILYLIAALALSFPQFVQAQGNPEATKLARQGADATKHKDWNKAVDLFRKAAELDNKNAAYLAAALQQRATAYQKEQKFQQAIADFTEALEIMPDDPDTRLRRAYAEMKLQDYDNALADYSEVIKRRPNDVQSYLTRSYIFELKGDAPHAIADYDKVLQLQPHNKVAKDRKQRLQALQAATQPSPPGPITPPPASVPPKKP